MLPTYPETLLDRAVDGVIQAASLQQASELARVQAFARRQITREREQARLEVAELRAAAAFEGYRDGVLHALGAAQGVIEDLQHAHAALANAVRDQTHASLQAMNASPDAVMEPICSAFLHRMSQVAAGPRPVLHVPQDHDALLVALRAEPRLHALDIRPADRRLPLLELGALAWELDLQGSLLEDVELALSRAIPGVQDRLNASAAQYSARLLDTLDTAAQIQGLARIKETQ